MAVKPRVLAVCFFTSPGSVADNFHTLSEALARRTRLSVLTSVPLEDRPVRGAADACYLDFSKFQVSRWMHPVTWGRLVRYARQDDYDLVFLYSEHPVHALVCRIARARRSLFWCLDPTPHSGSVSTIATIYEVAKRSLLRRADRVVVACDALRTDVVRRYGIAEARVLTCFHGVLDNLIFAEHTGSPAGVTRDIDVLFFGRLEAYKGVDVLMDAMRMLHAKGRACTTVVAGTGPFAVSPAPGVTVENRYVPDRELAGMIARSRVVVMPYRDATGSQVPQTAFAYGTPVIASAVGCLPAYVEDGITGFVVPPGDATALAGSIERLLADATTWERMSRVARERAATTFNNDELMERLLEDVLDGSG